jgi:autotransporter-associated beta strand protein
MPVLKKCPVFRAVICSAVWCVVFECSAFAQSSVIVKWGTHASTDTDGTSLLRYNDVFYDISTTSTPYQKLLDLNADGTLDSSGSTGLVELGFFDTDSSSVIAPNVDASNPFNGEWTPITMKTYIGQDWKSSGTNPDGVSYVVPDGQFYFITEFNSSTSYDAAANTLDSTTAYSNFQSNGGASDGIEVRGDTSIISASDFDERMEALTTVAYDAGSDSARPILGIRFYESSVTGQPADGDKYNTLVNTNWRWQAHTNIGTSINEITLYDWDDGQLSDTNYFEFDNTDAYTLNLSKVGTGNTQVANDDFVSTVTYFDGSNNLDASDGGHIFSGLSGSGNITLGDDGSDVYTLHVNGANNSYTFSGNLTNSIGEAADSTIIKTGSGEQIITGTFYAGDSATAGLVIQDGKLTLAGANGIKTLESIRNGSGGTPVLELNNTTSGTATLVVIGLSQTQSAEYDGSVVLNGSGSETKIKTTYNQASYDSEDYNRTQIFSGVVSSSASNKLVKGGVGELELSGNNTFTGGVEIDDGTLIAGHANALGASNAVTITKGKFEVDSGVTLTAGATITTGDSEKTMIGGRGDLNKAVTIGSADGSNYVDVISPGDGISSSLSNKSTQQQVSLGDRANAIGEFTVGALTLENGGVYDWEISDFTNAGNDAKAGVDWDLLKFDSLTFDDTNDVFTINIMSVGADGTAGAMAGGNVWGEYNQTSGFLFMQGSWAGHSAGTYDAFNVVDPGWSHYNDQHLHEWSVWFDGTDKFYLQYSAVPEPSTYMMVTGLLMVPGVSYIRRLRKKKQGQTDAETEDKISS